MKLITPNRPAPITMLSPMAMNTVRSPNSDSGMSGSAARRSTTAKTATPTMAVAMRASMVAEPQANSVPPQAQTSTTHEVVTASTAMPQMSSGVLR